MTVCSELTKLVGHDSLAGPDCSQWPTRLHADHLRLISDRALIRITDHGYHGYWVSSSIHC